MEPKGSLALRLDEVRPRGAPKDDVKHPVVKVVPKSKTLAPPKKTVVTYRVSAKTARNKLESWGKYLFFFLAVIVPTIVSGLYYVFVASPQYVSEFRFSVRPSLGTSSAASAAVDTMLAMSNSFIVSDYVGSRDAVLSLEKAVDLSRIYSANSADFLSRLPPDASIEKLVDYWNSRIHTSYDLTTGINVVEVSAFSPQDAQKITAALKELCEKLVNQISDAARKSQMEFAHSELQRAEDRLKDVRKEESALRTDQKSIDARKEADGKLQLNIKMRGELATLESEYSSLSQYMDAKSPKLTVLKNQIAATREQIAQLQNQVSNSRSSTGQQEETTVDSEAITRYDQIQTDLEMAAKLYESALTNYELSRAQANNNQIYLATYVQPGLPEIASYPRAFFDTFLIFLSACGVWVVLTLVYYSIRDHV